MITINTIEDIVNHPDTFFDAFTEERIVNNPSSAEDMLKILHDEFVQNISKEDTNLSDFQDVLLMQNKNGNNLLVEIFEHDITSEPIIYNNIYHLYNRLQRYSSIQSTQVNKAMFDTDYLKPYYIKVLEQTYQEFYHTSVETMRQSAQLIQQEILDYLQTNDDNQLNKVIQLYQDFAQPFYEQEPRVKTIFYLTYPFVGLITKIGKIDTDLFKQTYGHSFHSYSKHINSQDAREKLKPIRQESKNRFLKLYELIRPIEDTYLSEMILGAMTTLPEWIDTSKPFQALANILVFKEYLLNNMTGLKEQILYNQLQKEIQNKAPVTKRKI